MVKAGLASTSIKLYLSRLRTAFNYAIKPLKMIISNPTIDIDIVKDKAKSNTKRALTQNELTDLLSKIKNRKYYIVSLIVSKCGLRIGEILGLTWNNIDDKKCVMHVKQQWKKKTNDEPQNDDKNNSYGYDFGELKSKNSDRIVPIPHKEKDEPKTANTIDVMEELLKYKEQYPININRRLFNYKNVTSICSDLRQVYTKAGYDISVHELRHTYTTTLIANGMDFKTVAQLIGDDVIQVMKTYSHVNDDMMECAISLINKIL
jgi:integrase